MRAFRKSTRNRELLKEKSDSILRGAGVHVRMEFIIFTGSKYVGEELLRRIIDSEAKKA